MKKVCLITPSHIASNPRLVKEAAALSENGYALHLVFTQNLPWLARHDKHILAQHPQWTYDVLDVNKNRKLWALLQKIAAVFTVLFPSLKNILINRNFYWQLRKSVNNKADLYIAHNLGALHVAVLAAKKTGAKSAFDAEDFHRHETGHDDKHHHVKLKIFIEEKYLPKTAYITAASPMIAEKYEALSAKKVIVILNVFNRINTQQIKISTPEKPLKIFWFSQTIGPNRGLETAMKAINLITAQRIEFHLLGSPQAEYVAKLQQMAGQFRNHSLYIHKSVLQDELLHFASTFDIGLASESGFSINNTIALSNKLFTYLQCGLAVLASDTDAQKSFFEDNPGIGKCYEKENAASLAKAISFYAQNRNELLKTRKHNFQLGQDIFNWEIESRKFLSIINHVLPL